MRQVEIEPTKDLPESIYPQMNTDAQLLYLSKNQRKLEILLSLIIGKLFWLIVGNRVAFY